MSNYVIKYGRDDRVKYISHLDFMRCFHRAVRRSELNFAFSQGFNPHPIMTVAQPLSVGVTSECEYMKVGFDGEYSENDMESEPIDTTAQEYMDNFDDSSHAKYVDNELKDLGYQ